MADEAVKKLLWQQVDPKEYRQVRRLWVEHSKAEDSRDIPGLLATLTEDCVYVMPQSGVQWEGHEGAEQFYTTMLAAFPDIHFDLTNIVIGPQGVVEEATATGTFTEAWLDYEPHGRKVTMEVIIFFPWDREQKLFSGERIFLQDDAMLRE